MKSQICSRRFSLLAATFCLLTVPTAVLAQGTVNFIPPGANWRNLDDGSDPGDDWTYLNFNDSAWSTGAARLGFGNDGEQTQLQSGHVSYYFRHVFTAAGVSSISNLQVRLKRDDGVVVYVNEMEVFRNNMPVGTISNLTLAVSAASGPNETNVFLSPVLTSSLLKEGANVVAVEVHQASVNDGDLGFDLELVGNVPELTSFTVMVSQAWSTIANNFVHGGNTLNEVIPLAVDGTMILKWNELTQLYSTNVYDAFSGTWSPNATLAPGEGAFVYSPTAQTFSFNGQVAVVGYINRPPGGGWRFVGCRVPRSSTFPEVMGFAPADGDRLLFYEGSFASYPLALDSQATRIFTYRNGDWHPSCPPLVSPGQGVFVDLVGAPTTFQGYAHTPLGGATLAIGVPGQLEISPLLGPAAGGVRSYFGAVERAEATFAETVVPNSQNSNVLFGVTVLGGNGLSLAQVTMSNSMFGVSVLDVSALLPFTSQTARYTVRVWQGTSLVYEQTNRSPPAAGSLANHLLLTPTPKEVKVQLDESGRLMIAFNVGANLVLQMQVWDATQNAANVSGDRLEFISEAVLNPPAPDTSIDFLGALEFQLRLPQKRTLTAVVANKFGHQASGVGNGQLTGGLGYLRVDLPSVGGNDGVKFDLAGKSSAEVTIEIPSSPIITQLVSSVVGDIGSLSDVTLIRGANVGWNNQFNAVVNFGSLAPAAILVEALNNGTVIASSNTLSGAPVSLAVSPASGASALKVGAQVNADGSLTRTLTLAGSSFNASLPGGFQDVGPLNQVRITSVGGAALPPGVMKQLSARGQAAVVGYYFKVLGLTSSANNPFRPQSFVGNVVTAIGNATLARNENGDVLIGNLGTVGGANGVRIVLSDSRPGLHDHVEFAFDSVLSDAGTPVGTSFRYDVEGANGSLDSIEGRSINANNPFLVNLRTDPMNFATRTVALYLHGTLVYQEAKDFRSGYFAFDAQPRSVSARIEPDSAMRWEFDYTNSVGFHGFVGTFSPRNGDRLVILSAASVIPPGTEIRAVQILGSGVPSRTLLAPPPALGVSFVNAGGTLGLQVISPLTARDQFLQQSVLSSSGGTTGFVPLSSHMILPLDPPPGGYFPFLPVDPTIPGAIIRARLTPPPASGTCAVPSTAAMNYFKNSSTGWRLPNLWNLLANPWVAPGPPVQALHDLMAESARLTGLGFGPSSPQQQFTRELLDAVTDSNPATLGVPDGPDVAHYTVWYVDSLTGSPLNDGTMTSPLNSIQVALDKALTLNLPAVELQLRGTFSGEPTAHITRHTRIIQDTRAGTPPVTVRALIEAAAPFRFELKNVGVGASPGSNALTVNSLAGAYTLLENVTLTSVTHDGGGATGEGRGALVMRGCRVKNTDGPGIKLNGGVAAFISDCIVTDCQYGGLLVCGNSPLQTTDTSATLLRTTIAGNGTVQSHAYCTPTVGAVVASGKAFVRMDWCRVERNHGPAVAAVGAPASICMRYSSVTNVLPFNSAPAGQTFAIGIGAYGGAHVEVYFSDIGGIASPFTSDYAIQLASGGSAVLGATRVHNFPIPANVQTAGYDPSLLDGYCLYEGVPLLPVNTDSVPTPAP